MNYTHAADFVDERLGEETYARFVINYFLMPAILKWDFEPFMREKKLFATYKGERVRVTGASVGGDIWLSRDFNRTKGYDSLDMRVAVEELSEWSPTPEYTEKHHADTEESTDASGVPGAQPT